MKTTVTYIYCQIILIFLVLMLSSFSLNTTIANYHIKTIVIDAGHGGHDAGCSGKHSKEKHITLKVAKQLKDYIQKTFPDLKIILTRDQDVFIPLHERSAIANRNKADLFISIHCNAAPGSKSVKGTETYVMGLHKNESNLEVAKRENAVILEETDYANYYDGFDPNSPMAHITFSLFQNAYQEQSIVFADLIEKQFSERAGRKSRGVKQAGFLVLYKTAMPSVLIESGFLTNQSEEDFLHSTYGQEIIASAIYRAFKEYKVLVEEKGSAALIEPEIEDEPNSKPVIVDEPEPVMIETNPIAGEPIIGEAIKSSDPKKNEIEDEAKKELSISKQAEAITPSQADELSFIENYLSRRTKETENKTNEVKQEPQIFDELIDDSTIVYKVQIFLSSNETLLNQTDLNYINSLEIEAMDNGLKRYLSGRFLDYESSKLYCDQLRSNGFPDAFVVKYRAGKRVP